DGAGVARPMRGSSCRTHRAVSCATSPSASPTPSPTRCGWRRAGDGGWSSSTERVEDRRAAAAPLFLQSSRQHLRQVPPPNTRQLLQLRAAGEAVGQDDRALRGIPDRGEHLLLGAGGRDLVVALLEAEVACQAAAAARQFAGE